MSCELRSATTADHAAVLALNLECEAMLSPLDRPGLAHLAAQSAHFRVATDAGRVVAFVLALREGADYDSPNYRWFAQRYPRFLYVDRVAVAGTHQGRQIGGRLYGDLFAFARERGIATVACEFYIEPLNAASSRFHARWGFREAGTQWVADGRKKVSLQVATVPSAG